MGCLRIIGAVTLCVKDSDRLILGWNLTIMAPYAV